MGGVVEPVFSNLDNGAFVPPRLGRRVKQDPRAGETGNDPGRELPGRSTPEAIEKKTERDVLKGLQEDFLDGTWIQPILGGPGAGKSRLLREWSLSLAADHHVIVTFVPLRSIETAGRGEEFLNHLSDIGVEKAAAIGLPTLPRDGNSARIWFLDGLDEVRDALWDDGFGDKLASLPGPKVVTCRSAVFSSRIALLGEGSGRFWRPEWEIQPLNEEERAAFVTARVGKVADHNLLQTIEASSALRGLAETPLLLGMMTELGLPLPSSRAAFYERAEKHMADRRAKGTDHDRRWNDALQTLDHLAEKMTPDHVEAPLKLLFDQEKDSSIRDVLTESGIIIVSPGGTRFSFFHPTFQEYHVARSLLRAGLDAALEDHWQDEKYEEILSLAISLLVDQGEAQKAASRLDDLVGLGKKLWRDDPQALFSKRRSVVRVCLHLLTKSAASGPIWPLMRSLSPLSEQPVLFRLAVAVDVLSPPEALAILANDEDSSVRERVAENAGTPPVALAVLASDENKYVRLSVARNARTPTKTLAVLASDEDKYVRSCVAWNARTPTKTLAVLASDEDEYVRVRVAGNAKTPFDSLVALAGDNAILVLSEVYQSARISLETLVALGGDQKYVRLSVARNARTPPETLVALANDDNSMVLEAVVRNTKTPPEVLTTLARHEYEGVRIIVARNSKAPGILEALACDDEVVVRAWVAKNVNTPLKALEALARDKFSVIREAVAGNAGTPPEVLTTLARDGDSDVRQAVAWNVKTPPEVLTTLARDGDSDVRQAVARNVRTPPEVLAIEPVREAVAMNAAASMEFLLYPRYGRWWWRAVRWFRAKMSLSNGGLSFFPSLGRLVKQEAVTATKGVHEGFFRAIGTSLYNLVKERMTEWILIFAGGAFLANVSSVWETVRDWCHQIESILP